MFLISLKAGGFGLNLTEADYCFLLDPWWNPAAEAQAIDRTHRIGQTRHVMVYRLIARDTIEEKVMALQARKAALFAGVMDEGAALRRAAHRRRHPRASVEFPLNSPPSISPHTKSPGMGWPSSPSTRPSASPRRPPKVKVMPQVTG